MQNDNGAIETPLQRLKGRTARRYSVGTKLTRDELKTIIEAAQARSKSPSEWTRETLLDAARNGPADDLSGHLFTELVGIQMLIMETFEPLLCGQRLTQEEVAIKFQRVQKSKAAKAQELLAKRSQRASQNGHSPDRRA
jgi:hypothetical protein